MFSDENLPSSSRSRETDTFSLASTVDQSETSTIRRRTSDETLLSQATTLVPSSASTLRRRRSEDTLLDSFRGGASNIRHRASEETLLSVPESVPLLDQPQLCNNLIKNLYDDTIKLLGMMARIVSNQCFHGYDHLSSRFKWTAQLLENWEFLVCRQYRPGQIDLSDMEAMLLKAGHKEVYRNVFTALAEYLFLFWNMVYTYIHTGAAFNGYHNLIIRHVGFDWKTFEPSLSAALDAAVARARAAARCLGVDVHSLGNLEGQFNGKAYASLFDQGDFRRRKRSAIETIVMERLGAYEERLRRENERVEEARAVYVARRDVGGA